MTSNASLHKRRMDAVPRGVGNAYAIYAERASNAEIIDVEGKRYIDFAGGIAVLNAGHRHPKVMAAVQAQLRECYTHTAFQVMADEPYIALAERLNALAPFKGPAKTILFTTGAEAVENAIKIARAATGRPGVIAFTGAFHGRTLLTMGLTGKVLPQQAGPRPVSSDLYHVPFPIEPRSRLADSPQGAQLPVQGGHRAGAGRGDRDRAGAGRRRVLCRAQGAPGRALRKLCDAHGILLISDEVQAGFARTGKMFGIEHSGVEPDLIRHRQVARRRLPALGRGRPRRDHGTLARPAAWAAPTAGTRSPARPRWRCLT